MRLSPSIALTSGLLLAAANAFATDGVLEVNQACVAAGCFSGDAGGFPVTIDGSAGRSVRLTSDLVVPNANTTAILVRDSGATDGVSIDLGGFTIRGPTRCSLPPIVACAPIGSGKGVDYEDLVNPAPVGVVVRNGSVLGMGSNGILLGPMGVVEGVSAGHNPGMGIAIDAGGSVLDSRAYSNGHAGIRTNRGSIRGSVAALNGQNGIDATLTSVSSSTAVGNVLDGIGCNNCSITGSVASENGSSGIVATGGTVSQSTAEYNQGDGITGFQTAITGNSATQNGTGGTGDGISCPIQCLVQGNTVTASHAVGLRLGNDVGYRENVITGNMTGPVVLGVNLGDNLCAGPGTLAASCP